jgi:GAF domain-containing protein
MKDDVHRPPSSDVQATIRRAPPLPFRTELTLAPLVAYWTGSTECASMDTVVQMIRARAAAAPELTGAIEDLAVIERHVDLVDTLMAAVFPPALWDEEYGAALVPFQLRAFYATPAAERVLLDAGGGISGRVNLDPATLARFRDVRAWLLVLQRVYGLALDVEYPLIFTVPDRDTGLDRHFRVVLDGRFIDVVPQGTPPGLPPAVRERLAAGHVDPDALAAALPPDRFLFRGFTLLRAHDVTDQEVLASLSRDLIDKESIVSTERFRDLQAKLRTLFRRPDLNFGLAALEGERVLVLNYGARLDHACIFADSAHHAAADFAGTLYERAVLTGEPVIVRDLAARAPSGIEGQMAAAGIRTCLAAPLHYQNRVIGTLELNSPTPGALDAMHLPKLRQVLPLFAVAVQRSMEELNTRIQAVIKEKCTAIHPSVEWRFRKAVLDAIERQGAAPGGVELGPIVFEGVYPLYGLADVRGSSTQRTLAIQADLLTQLRLAREVVDHAYRARALPALDELRYRIDRHAERAEGGLRSGDETGIVDFLKSEVEALLAHLAEFGAGVRGRVDAYRDALDPRLGVVYDRRRLFEQSVTALNDAISGYLDLEQQAAQEMFPHYFEKQKTDGVDYQIYVGASLREDGGFDPLYLRNLRLWQLMVTCGIALRAHQLGGRLPVPLEVTHLVLAQQAPLAIRFRFDEKRFDVDGAYNIRYEIVKKRIDKAVVRGTSERVTQPGRIAIVYAHPAEAAEYLGYFEYLEHLGYLVPGVEDLELEELQGVRGLRALRVGVNLDHPPADRAAAVLAAQGRAGAGPVTG